MSVRDETDIPARDALLAPDSQVQPRRSRYRMTDERLRDEKIRSVNRQDVSLEYVDPGEARGLLEQAWAGGVVLDYVPVTSEEDLSESEVLRRVVLFTARGLCVARGLDPGPEMDPSSIPGHRITLDEFYGWRVDRERRRVLMRGDDLVKRDPDRYTVGTYEFGVYFRTPWISSDEPDEPVDIEPVGDAGYGNAFLEPPYSITLQPRVAQDLFFAIDDALLKRPGAETEIWKFESEWDPHGACWSPYFEYMWWYSCMWTVRTGPQDVVVIGASATD
jgi:hypothetical protein